MSMENQVILYQPNETIKVDVRLDGETVWLSQAQIAQLFQRDQSTIARHIKCAFDEEELDKDTNMHFLHIASSDRPVAYYSLDVIISVGYRVKSVIGTRFRQWALRSRMPARRNSPSSRRSSIQAASFQF